MVRNALRDPIFDVNIKLLSFSLGYLRADGKQSGFSHSPPFLRGDSMFLLVQRDRTACCCLSPLGDQGWDQPCSSDGILRSSLLAAGMCQTHSWAHPCHGLLGPLVSKQPHPKMLHQHKEFKCPCKIRITFPVISWELPRAFTVTQTLGNDTCQWFWREQGLCLVEQGKCCAAFFLQRKLCTSPFTGINNNFQ